MKKEKKAKKERNRSQQQTKEGKQSCMQKVINSDTQPNTNQTIKPKQRKKEIAQRNNQATNIQKIVMVAIDRFSFGLLKTKINSFLTQTFQLFVFQSFKHYLLFVISEQMRTNDSTIMYINTKWYMETMESHTLALALTSPYYVYSIWAGPELQPTWNRTNYHIALPNKRLLVECLCVCVRGAVRFVCALPIPAN